MAFPLRVLVPFLAGGGLLVGAAAGPQDERPVDFATQVGPLLAARCHECHGPAKQKAGLRLDSRAAAMRGSYGGEEQVILPGDGAGSLLYRRVAGLVEHEDPMPPKGERLDEVEIELLRRWIDEGAVWPDDGEADAAHAISTHWAYQRPVRPELPAVRDEAWCASPIDRFVLARLEAEGLAPSPEADRATLLRRASLDLCGLPPTLEELDAFLADDAPDAFERAVDRLLASPAYAAHMARGWLDLARYADTNGYEKDDRRVAWRWRDWVIDAFARDLPFDEFSVQQLAGDLLPDATLETRIATGFHRNTMVNLEGGTDPEEFRVAAVVDRVNTTASVWLGTTLACAQCHNHKYDPFSQKEYFQLYAFFDSTRDTGNSLEPQVRAPRPGDEQALAALEAQLAELDARFDVAWRDEELAQWRWELAAREALSRPSGWSVPRVVEARSLGGATLAAGDDGVVLVSGAEPERDVYELTLTPPAGKVRALRLEAPAHAGLVGPGPGRAPHGNFVLTGVEVSIAGAEGPAAMASAHASFEQRGFPVRLAIDGDAASGWAVGDGSRAVPAEAVFVLAEPLVVPEGGALRVVLRFESGYARHTLGALRLSVGADEDAALLAALPDDVRAALAVFPALRGKDERVTLRRWWRTHASERGRALAGELARAEAERDAARAAIPSALVLEELATARDTRLLQRGSFLSPGEPVERDVPAVLNPWPEGAPRNRLGLARWLVDPANPLTARVLVNRAWDRLFGRGLVATVEDFGARGDAPTHPELLDWLAVELVEDGWSMKRLMRRLVTSATWRQASRVTPELLERDPGDLLLARAPRVRLEAEVVRDAALASAGLLDPAVGGPSVFPPQPEGIWASTYSGDRWRTSEDGDRWRRGMYTFLKRTSPYPSFTTFDATSREVACTRRSRTNTPLQALTLLNDPAFVEAAVGLARRTLLEAGQSDEERVTHAFRLVTARVPTAREREVLLGLLAEEHARYRADPDAARALTTTSIPLPIAGLDPAELAAWTVVANALLNTDEFVTRS